MKPELKSFNAREWCNENFPEVFKAETMEIWDDKPYTQFDKIEELCSDVYNHFDVEWSNRITELEAQNSGLKTALESKSNLQLSTPTQGWAILVAFLFGVFTCVITWLVLYINHVL